MNSMASRVFSLASTPAITVSPGGTSTGSSFGAVRRRVGISFRSDDRTGQDRAGQDRTGETALAFGGPPGMWKRAEALVAQQKAQPSGHDMMRVDANTPMRRPRQSPTRQDAPGGRLAVSPVRTPHARREAGM